MKLYPEQAGIQLEFDKIKSLLGSYCYSIYAKKRAGELRVHTKKNFVEAELAGSDDFARILIQGVYFPNDHVFNLEKEIRLLSLPGAVLSGGEIMELRKLVEDAGTIFRWFDADRRSLYPALTKVVEGTYYEKAITLIIDGILDEKGEVKDQASESLRSVRAGLAKRRNELRKQYEKIISRLNRQGYLAEIEESFLNGRKVLAVFAEQKRTVKGILHGESESRRTAFIEPEETIELNNEIYSLEEDERREVARLLRKLTADLSVYSGLLSTYHSILGEFDFIRAKGKLAVEMNAACPLLEDRAGIELNNAFHPLLFLYNKKAGKSTVPVSLTLDEKNRILVISGPNAGGKTVAMKTAGLLQMMVQSGLLVPAGPGSRFGIFKQIMIHIGDTQSIEFELSTYSAHLLHMKYFIEQANGRTLFFIDELGSGSDPGLGGAFAEVILEEMLRKQAMGIVTTHYLNLKIMAGKTPGIQNGAMAFDEKNLMPLYKLVNGKPGSSYTFSIAERIGLDPQIINRARKKVDEGHFRLDKLLNKTEQELQTIETRQKELEKKIRENERLKREMEETIRKEKHLQQTELLQLQNRQTEEKLVYLRDMERKLKQIISDWKKEEDKSRAVKNIHALLFSKQKKAAQQKAKKKLEKKFEVLDGEIRTGTNVMIRKNYQVGKVLEIRGKKAIVKIGTLPMQVELKELVLVKNRAGSEPGKQ